MWPFRKRPPSPRRRLRQANDALRAQDYASAISAYRSLLEETPENTALLLNLGTALHLSGQHTPAIERFSRVLELDPQNATALINMAAAHGSLGHVDKAIELLASVLDIDPVKRDLHYNLAALYMRKGLLANAMAELELELASHPDHALAQKTLAEMKQRYLGRK